MRLWPFSLPPPPWARRLAPWASLALVWLSFELPMALAPNRIDLRLMRPTADVLVVLVLLGVSHRVRFGRALRLLLAALVLVLALVRLDRAIFFALTRTEPLLYDQLFLVRHFVVLVTDLFGLELFLVLLGVAGAGVVAVAAARASFRSAARLLEPSRRTEVTVAMAALSALIGLGTVLGPRPPKRAWVKWMAVDLVRNVAESRRFYRALGSGIPSSPYGALDRLPLTTKPDVLLLFVESYGKLLAEHPRMRPAWETALSRMEARLGGAGWSMVSAYSTAPVTGGRSWIAVGSILMGTKVEYESEFRHLMGVVDRLPTLVRFFERHGYRTVLLAPADRSRLGITAENPFGYERYVRFADLQYRGPPFGWGVVPDEYALGFTEEHVLGSVPGPLFFHFHMVSSHAPWRVVPDPPGDGNRTQEGTGIPPAETLTDALGDGFVKSVLYDLRVVEDFLRRRRRDTLVVLMGDHQPPMLAPETLSFDVPIHILARDPALLDELRERGFSPGLVLPRSAKAAVEHAGLFSLLVRALARARGGGSALPPYHPHGFVH